MAFKTRLIATLYRSNGTLHSKFRSEFFNIGLCLFLFELTVKASVKIQELSEEGLSLKMSKNADFNSIYNSDLQLKSARNHVALFERVTSEEFKISYSLVKSRTMLSIERLYDLYLGVKYVNQAEIQGAILEVGVWKGGALGMALLSDTTNERKVIGFDTFEGHYAPNSDEVDIHGNNMLHAYQDFVRGGNGWAKASESDCYDFLISLTKKVESDSSIHPLRVNLVRGDIKETAKNFPYTPLAILRLDCDWYPESLASLKYFWPMLQPKGLLIMDDYGHHSGQKKAFDEYFFDKVIKITHVDYSCILVQKI